jgi:integrase
VRGAISNDRPYRDLTDDSCLTSRNEQNIPLQVFRAVSRQGTAWGKGVSENVVWYVVRNCAQRMQLDHLAPHDLRRTCAKLCHVNGGELEQIQFLLGHASVLTTERYLGCKQNLEEPVNDRFGCLFSRTLDLG